MKILKSILLFLFLLVVIFLLRTFSDFVIIEPISFIFDLIPFGSRDVCLRFDVSIIYMVICFTVFIFVSFFKFFEKNVFWNNKWHFLRRHWLYIFIIFMLLGFFSDIVGWCLYFVISLLWYFIFKKYFSDIILMQKYFLNFNSVKKYFIIFFLLETPFYIQLVVSLLKKKCDIEDTIFFFALSNLRFYLPIFIASWCDNRKTIQKQSN